MLGWLLLAVLVAAGVLTGLLALFNWPEMPPPAAFDPVQLLELLKIALAVVAGLGGVVLLAVNLRKQRVTEAEHRLAQSRDQREQEQSFNERYGTAAEQLAHEHPAVRLAGVYAMAGLADDWSGNQQICVDVLCGYLRLPAVEGDGSDVKVRETVVGVLRERLSGGWARPHVDLDLSGAVLADMDFTSVATSGWARFDGARFEGGRTILDLRWLSNTTFSAAEFLAERTEFGKAELLGAVFRGGTVVLDAERVQHHTVDLIGCQFQDVTISFRGTQRWHCPVNFRDCEFSGCTFEFRELGKGPRDLDAPHVNCTIRQSVLADCTIDLRDAVQGEHLLWLVDTELHAVRFEEEIELQEDDVKWLNVRDLTLHDTELPERHVRYRD